MSDVICPVTNTEHANGCTGTHPWACLVLKASVPSQREKRVDLVRLVR